jgi:hypothetical protein
MAKIARQLTIGDYAKWRTGFDKAAPFRVRHFCNFGEMVRIAVRTLLRITKRTRTALSDWCDPVLGLRITRCIRLSVLCGDKGAFQGWPLANGREMKRALTVSGNIVCNRSMD